ncbi:3-deoxy-D-manno-octulosonic-acid transferase [compost metagenome]
MREAGALKEVADASVLHEALQQLQADNVPHLRMVQAGLEVLKANRGVLERLLVGLERFLPLGAGWRG